MRLKLHLPLALFVLGYLAVGACTWVDPDAGAEHVALLLPKQASNCKSLGTTTVEVKDKVSFYNRDEEKVAEELLTLARNAAVKSGGNAVVALGDPLDGTRKFKIYKCP